MSRFALLAAVAALALPAAAGATRTVYEFNGHTAATYDDLNEFYFDIYSGSGESEDFFDDVLISGLRLDYGGTVADGVFAADLRYDDLSARFAIGRPIYALGFDYNQLGAADTVGFNIQVGIGADMGDISGLQVRPGGTQGFFGIIADDRIQELIFSGRPGFGGRVTTINIDNLSVVDAAVPEPATWGLMILGFGVIGIAARRRRHAPVLA